MGRQSGKRNNGKLDISYVLPTYNRVEYLGECILTLMEQNYPKDKYEIIVVDDGSVDSTGVLIRFFTQRYKNIRYYRNQHKGVEAARNFGNKKAKADIIGVCDSDDLYHQDRTKLTIAYFKKHPAIDIMNGSYTEINHQGLKIRYYPAEKIQPSVFFKGNMTFFCHDNCAYKKDKILTTPYRKGSQTDDWKLVHDWLKADYKFGFVREELCKVRTLKNGIMGARREKLGVELAHA